MYNTCSRLLEFEDMFEKARTQKEKFIVTNLINRHQRTCAICNLNGTLYAKEKENTNFPHRVYNNLDNTPQGDTGYMG